MFFKRELEDRVEDAKKNKEELNRLIEEYKPFIASTAQKRVKRYLRYGQDDELAIGMLAFKEAIDAYDRKKGKFLTFAKMIINLRLIDYFRKNKRINSEICLYGYQEKTNINIQDEKSIHIFNDSENNRIRKEEILEYKKELLEWGIEFQDLVRVSPKHKKLRELYKEIAILIINSPEILKKLIRAKRLPIKEIQNRKKIHRKKLERGRIYIIASVIALKGDYTFIRDYINGGEK
ncbi:RNA polymerase sigma-I factor [Clostridium sp. D2Q-14]|uniref:RNA polymerase sigma-I factor n=1 Tax=Anaeromonas gelatinilytica TaxID=2683194 RepID=UPI00193BB170|nr:RNA polymerase sigma-I factor [Anaeromonas gelatinilytica]MBS4536172.1 RNA polymerase sigma-I factor [Anaeromonas gelatinilytica]